jgi:aspartate racemase
MAEDVQASVGLPLVHIADVTGEVIRARGFQKVGLLGSKFTMEEDFYRGRLLAKYGIETLIPREEDRLYIDDIIDRELCLGLIERRTQMRFKEIIEYLVSSGSQGVILGCTEIPLLIKQADSSVPLFDTTTLHAKAAALFALGLDDKIDPKIDHH